MRYAVGYVDYMDDKLDLEIIEAKDVLDAARIKLTNEGYDLTNEPLATSLKGLNAFGNTLEHNFLINSIAID